MENMLRYKGIIPYLKFMHVDKRIHGQFSIRGEPEKKFDASSLAEAVELFHALVDEVIPG